MNDEKRRLQPYHERQMVTGLIVNEKLNLPREKIRGLRALLHNVKEHGWASQVGRTSIFDSMDEWREYIAGTGANHIEVRQQKNRRLLNPAAVLANARTVAELQEVVQGKVAFVGAVRGEEDPVYQRMLRTLHKLTGRYARYAEEKAKGADYFRTHRYMDPADDEAARRESQVQHYRQFKQWEAKFKKGKLSSSEFCDHLATWKDHALEIGWLLQRTDGMERDTLKEVGRIASQLDTDPRETSHFFQEFDEDIGFRGLLHAPDEGSAPPQMIIGACWEALENTTLPNQLENHTNRILNKCDTCLEKNPNRYPWPPYREETNLKKDLQDYKKAVRFHPGKPDQGLFEQLRSYLEDLESEFGVSFAPQGRDKYFRTYTPVVLPAIKTILSSMAEHTKSDTVRLSVDRVDTADSRDVVVRIWDDDSSIDDAPNLTSLFRGDTRRALYQQNTGAGLPGAGLRGYAHWTIIAPFSDGSSDGSVYEFDVMRNTRSEAHNHQLGVMHRLTFPQ